MRETEEILKDILRTRGITDQDDIAEFLSERPQKTYDPFLLHNMEAGVDLLLKEINNGTKICIYGDYDADGVTSVCILSNAIRMLTDNFIYYIPSRFDEGYGLNREAVSKIHETGTGLIITVDCGSVSYEEVEYAKELGMKVIVTDHHSIDDVRADCILINPKQKECGYPFSELAGCGIAFKMVQAIQQRAGLPKSVVTEVLDLAAVGTVGDIVSLKDENRTIVKYGLNKINARQRRSLRCLNEKISLKNVTSENIAFGIAPHINAAGRMAHASEAVELFMSDNENVIRNKADRLVALNAERKKLQEDAYNSCIGMITGDENFIIIKADDIHEGIAGIVAGKIKENYNRPVIILTETGEGKLKGTGRSIPSVDIFRLLKKHDSLFERFGGHRSACGLTMSEDNYDKLTDAVSEEMTLLMEENPELFENPPYWDIEISPEEITVELARELDRMEPFGQDNPRPVLLMKHVHITNIKSMGADGIHVRFTALSDSGYRSECVLFQKAHDFEHILRSGQPVDILGCVSINSWNGRESSQFIVEEIIQCR
ncbi:MAG: single-stranded-DNA-specific exonuclease RecJ [Lentihominibacter sp.]